jgi:hypothetical protein
MKRSISSRGLFGLGFVILLATNILVLAGVASNRWGEPEARITLTRRELPLAYHARKENSGLSLRLAWRALGKNEDYSYYPGWRSPAWLNAEKLEELGFAPDDYLRSEDKTTSYKQPIPKEVFIVLENNGEAYREAVRRAEAALKREKDAFTAGSGEKSLQDNLERAEKQLKRERITESRLFAVDAGRDPRALREKYGDRTRFIITRGLVKPTYSYRITRNEIGGYIEELSVENIHVSLRHRKVFDILLAQDRLHYDEFDLPGYEVELAYGSRHEPWIVSVRPADHTPDQKSRITNN